MNNQQRRNFLIALALFLIMVITGIVIGYLPVNKIIKIPAGREAGLIERKEHGFTVPNTLLFDFEMDSASVNTDRFYKGIAHSGQYSVKAFGNNSYTPAIERKAGDIGIGNLRAIAMSAWIYVFPGKNDPLGNLVFAASNNKINITWKGIRFDGGEVPRGRWFKISGLFDLSDVRFKPETKLEFYFWNNSNTDILADDLYIVFGGPKPRRGDSTRVDLTNGKTFAPAVNFPPFPFDYFKMDDIHNENSSFLIKKGEFREGDISPYDRIIPGRFVSGPSGTEDLLVVTRSGDVELFTFCSEKKEFKKINLVISPDLLACFHSAEVLEGYFTTDGNDQVLISGKREILLGEFGRIKNPCQGKDLQSVFKSVLHLKENPLTTGQERLIAADLDGNKQSELLTVSPGGTWKLIRIEPVEKDPLRVLASGTGGPGAQWNSMQMNYRITAGRFLAKYNQDLLLTVGKERSNPGRYFSLLRFDPGKNTLIPCFPAKQNTQGKTTGLDTLRPGDEYLTGIFDNSGKTRVYRYNRDWRYDLKEIRFNDTSFQVIANMDFSGYENDHNPKYFEILKLVPGMLVKPGITSLLVIGKNCKQRDQESKEWIQFDDLQELPNAIRVFSLSKTEK